MAGSRPSRCVGSRVRIQPVLSHSPSGHCGTLPRNFLLINLSPNARAVSHVNAWHVLQSMVRKGEKYNLWGRLAAAGSDLSTGLIRRHPLAFVKRPVKQYPTGYSARLTWALLSLVPIRKPVTWHFTICIITLCPTDLRYNLWHSPRFENFGNGYPEEDCVDTLEVDTQISKVCRCIPQKPCSFCEDIL